jgi:hypothetical protein
MPCCGLQGCRLLQPKTTERTRGHRHGLAPIRWDSSRACHLEGAADIVSCWCVLNSLTDYLTCTCGNFSLLTQDATSSCTRSTQVSKARMHPNQRCARLWQQCGPHKHQSAGSEETMCSTGQRQHLHRHPCAAAATPTGTRHHPQTAPLPLPPRDAPPWAVCATPGLPL